MVVVFLVTAVVLAYQKNNGEDVIEMRRFLTGSKEKRNTVV
jgi:hypothetical protein